MATKQREAMAKLVEQLPKQYPGCGILVWGSVMRGCERSNSDLDLFVVHEGNGPIKIRQGWRDGRQYPEHYVDDVCLDLVLMPSQTLAKTLEAKPYNFWFFARSQIIHDPVGLAKRYHAIAAAYFDAHPEVEAVWQRNSDLMRELKPKLKADPESGIKLPGWSEVAEEARAAALAEPRRLRR
ncbi:MAG: nucleotidyltransferase domain-containing protein [Phycisphaerae bacterium]